MVMNTKIYDVSIEINVSEALMAVGADEFPVYFRFLAPAAIEGMVVRNRRKIRETRHATNANLCRVAQSLEHLLP